MGQLGFGVMIGLLFSDESGKRAFTSSVGKTIAEVEIAENELLFSFSDGSKMKLFDDGQSCSACSLRYMDSDDDLPYFVGSTFQDAAVQDGPTDDKSSGDIEESAFLIISTSKGQFTVVNYNEHNGYYGGFLIRAAEVES